MIETTQPQVDETANQPDSAAAEAVESGGMDTGADMAETAQAEAGDPFLTVKYNKEERPLSKDDAVTYAQKGMNYDKVSDRLAEANAKLAEFEQGSLETLAREYAQKNGASSEQIEQMMREQLSYGLDEDAAKQAVVDVQLADFMARNPDVDPRSLPVDVLRAWSAGVPLGEAAAGYAASTQISQLQKQIAQLETNAGNAAASMGLPKSSGPAAAKPISKQAIENMSKAELARNHERIWAYLTGMKRDE